MTDVSNQSADGSSVLLATSGSATNEEDLAHASISERQLDTSVGDLITYPRILDASIPQIYRSEYPVTQINGCRQYGPPTSWTGPIPGFGCEIYVKRIPPDYTESDLVPLFERFGRLYELRLMMDYNNQNRRYCFVRYTTEEDAKVAIEVLNHHYVKENQTLDAQKSFEKCRLFVGNLPKDLDRKTIEVSFRSLFPEMTRFVMHNRIADGEKNRGFAFMDFPEHSAALRAKKQTTPGCMRMWNRDIKIVWANPQRSLDHSGVDEVKTLFVRNIDPTINSKDLYNLFTRVVPRQDIIKISRVREFAFVELASREQAELVMHAVQGYTLNKFPLDIEWAMPPLRNSFHNMKNYDFDALLRIKCIANGWDLPIILYGRVFTLSCLQYASIILRNRGQLHVYFVEIYITGLTDIQSRICEAVTSLIIENGTLPGQHLVLKVENDTKMLIGSVSSLTQPVLNLARDVDKSLKLFWNEIVDLCAAACKITQYNFNDLYTLYNRELEKSLPFPYLESIKLNDRIIGCLDRSFRCRPALNRKLDDREIIFVLCDQYTLTNYNFAKKDNYIAVTLSLVDVGAVSPFPYKIQSMFPSRFVQASGGRKIEAVFFGLNPYSTTEAPGGLALCMPNLENRQEYHQQPSNYYPQMGLNVPPLPVPPQFQHSSLFAPALPPQHPAMFADSNLLVQAMQQLGFTQHQMLQPQPFFGPPTTMTGGPPPPQLHGSMMTQPFYY
ncbi:uncharacterized protein LOC131425770 isoform X2 [Malaya genurostris]|uniref:uncharacterized protein LOC131425770 isoform X2 n=1 Tax=Malaya genurostris TaxID=325434 RepID=UPI0026F389BB|nr:uncharacterized protein LOC131425770 isoform X2 [Malaya genurostris]